MFGISKNAHSLMLRVVASLDRLDGVLGEAQLLVRNLDGLVTEVRDTLGAVRNTSAPDRKL